MAMAKTILRVALAACASAHAAEAATRVFIVDGNNARLRFSCDVLGLSEVEGAFTRFVAMVAIDEQAPGETRTVVKIDAASLTTDHTSWIEDLKGPDFFDVTRYPIVDFTSFTAVVEAPGVLSIPGKLTLRGVTQPVSLRVEYQLPEQTGTGYGTMKAAAELDRTAFGMDAYDLVLSDDVSIEVKGSVVMGFGQ
jgi:polyisoprenoid-binding protein YceI